MDTLLSFTGFGDPYSMGLLGDVQQPGPVLYLTAAKHFDRAILLFSEATRENALETATELRRRHPDICVETIELSIIDPSSYWEILSALRKKLRPVFEQSQEDAFFISVASGTRQMHACWILLCASGELPARILRIRPPRFATKEYPPVSEIDFSDPVFPVVRSVTAPSTKHGSTQNDWPFIAQEVGIIGDHPNILRPLEIASALAPYPIPVLLQGETGTGKELFARFIHKCSDRPEGAFVAVNCAALPHTLVESILFGHKKGAFTGASHDQTGKFVQAHGGTLFLDELGELPLGTQAKMLRVLENGIVEPLGDNRACKVDVRVIAATNRNLEEEIAQGNFREDFYYRFTEVIRLPPLRERRSDIPKIALHILDRVNTWLKTPKRLSQSAMEKLHKAAWTGNVRDLQNAIERAVLVSQEIVIQPEDISLRKVPNNHYKRHVPEPHEGFSLEQHIRWLRTQIIQRALELSQNNQSQAARLLGITPQAVHKFLRI